MRLKNSTWGTSDWRVLPLCLMHACFIQHRSATFCLVLQQPVSIERSGRKKFTMSGLEICLRTDRILIRNDFEPHVFE
jgi:hypothetical protein